MFAIKIHFFICAIVKSHHLLILEDNHGLTGCGDGGRNNGEVGDLCKVGEVGEAPDDVEDCEVETDNRGRGTASTFARKICKFLVYMHKNISN